MARPDPLNALRLTVTPIAPRPEFAAELRRRIEAALTTIAEGGGTMRMSEIGYVTMGFPDAERARDFYGSLLGWQFAPGDVPGGYQVPNLSPMGGLWGGAERPEVTLLFHVDDVDAAVMRVRELGGEADDPQDRPYGRMAECRDDQGLSFHLLERPGAR